MPRAITVGDPKYLRRLERGRIACQKWRAKRTPERLTYLVAYRERAEVLRKQWRAGHPEYKELEWRGHIRRAYGITVEQYNELLARQSSVCAICTKPNRTGERLHVDHDRKYKRVRGLLCNRCNRLVVPVVEHSPELISRTFAYLKENA